MNNVEVGRGLDACEHELDKIVTLIDALGQTSNAVPYLARYAVIRACGAVEIAFKAEIADYCVKRGRKQIKQYINKKVRESSANPSYERICSMLKDFDDSWCTNFKSSVSAKADHQKLKNSLQSLVDLRNDFAHGGSPSVTIGDVKSYFTDASVIIDLLDAVIV